MQKKCVRGVKIKQSFFSPASCESTRYRINNDFGSDNIHFICIIDEKYENESDSYGTNFEQEDYVKPERDEFNHKAWPSLSVRK